MRARSRRMQQLTFVGPRRRGALEATEKRAFFWPPRKQLLFMLLIDLPMYAERASCTHPCGDSPGLQVQYPPEISNQ